jgi:hypothetical protein
VPAHELGEPVVGVLAPGVRAEQAVEVGEHVPQPLVGLRVHRRIRAGQGVAQAGEALVEDLAAQSFEDLPVPLGRFRALPVVGGQLVDGAGGGAGQAVQLGLAEPGVVVVLPACQLTALGGERLVQQRLGAGDRPVQAAPAHRLPAQPTRPRGQVVQAPAAVRAPAQQVTQRLPEAAAGQHLLADLVDGGAHVVGRRERVGPAPPGAGAVPVAGHRAQPRPP